LPVQEIRGFQLVPPSRVLEAQPTDVAAAIQLGYCSRDMPYGQKLKS
jgi:hypothetical protein